MDDDLEQAFPKGSPYVADLSRAILNLTESDEMSLIKHKWFGDADSCAAQGSPFTSERLSTAFAEETAQEGGDARGLAPRIFTHDGGRFDNWQKMEKGYGVLLEMSFSLFSQKKHRRERNIGHSWICS